ncbi:MAG TPA: hypothetical protein EYQ50_08575 [Verrucomicrobiales bacterium]|nr:hypothetical protein [Verrucomicrobiales bacterium]HIL69149.1 hypothetical protein [Verrucomicrobiota bacterium]
MKNLLSYRSSLSFSIFTLIVASTIGIQAADWVVYPGGDGAGKGKHIVFVTGDEEYRSEEGMPMLAKILSVRHGFKCTVLFSINPETGEIDPNNQVNIPGIENLDSADMMVIFTRFRELPDDKMKHVVDFVNSGKPIMGLRTATHAFNYRRNPESPYAHYHHNSREWPGGFGQQVLGDTWISHHGHHKKEATRGLINFEHRNHPILRGVSDIFAPTDVYGIRNLGPDADILVLGQVLEGMKPEDKGVNGKKNNPMMPVVWTRSFIGESGKASSVIGTTLGASVDLESRDLRRLLVNACYWALGLENRIEADSNVDYVGEFHPVFYGFNGFVKGVKPSDHELK